MSLAVFWNAPGAVSPRSLSAWERRALLAARLGAAVALLSLALIFLYGGGIWRPLGEEGPRLRLDTPHNPFYLLLAFQAAAAWILAGAAEGWRGRLAAAARATGATALALLILTLPIDRTLAGKSAMPWRRIALAAALAGLALHALARPRPGKAGAPAPPGGQSESAAGSPVLPTCPSGASPLGAGGYYWLFAALAGWTYFRDLFSPFPGLALEDWMDSWLLAFGMFWAGRLALAEPDLRRALPALLPAALGMALLLAALHFFFGDGFFNLAAGPLPSLRERLASMRVTGASLHPNYLALLLALLTATVIPLFFTPGRGRAERALLLALILGGIGAMALTRSRGALLASLLVYTALVAVLARRKWIALAVFALLAAALFAARWERVAGFFTREHTPESWSALAGYRPAYWKFSLASLQRRPYTGLGGTPQVFKRLYEAQTEPGEVAAGAWHAHNLYLQVAFESGLAGLAIFLGVTLLPLVRLPRRARDPAAAAPDGLRWGYAAAILILLFHGLIDFPFNRGLWLLWGWLLAFLSFQERGLRDTKEGLAPRAARLTSSGSRHDPPPRSPRA